MANLFGEFDSRDSYFRSLTDRAFGPDPELADDAPQALESGGAALISIMLTALMNRGLSRQQEGYFASGAMVDAYFSRLERRVFMLRAFTDRTKNSRHDLGAFGRVVPDPPHARQASAYSDAMPV